MASLNFRSKLTDTREVRSSDQESTGINFTTVLPWSQSSGNESFALRQQQVKPDSLSSMPGDLKVYHVFRISAQTHDICRA